MIVHVRASNHIEIREPEADDVTIVTHTTLLPYLAGILHLHGIGSMHHGAVRLDPTWPGWGDRHGYIHSNRGDGIPECAPVAAYSGDFTQSKHLRDRS